MELRYLLPDEFEISTGNDINTAKGSVSMRQACARIHDSVFQFYDMSKISDVMKATEGNMEHVAYEIQDEMSTSSTRSQKNGKNA